MNEQIMKKKYAKDHTFNILFSFQSVISSIRYSGPCSFLAHSFSWFLQCYSALGFLPSQQAPLSVPIVDFSSWLLNIPKDLRVFSIYTFSLGDLRHSNGYKWFLHANHFQVYISTPVSLLNFWLTYPIYWTSPFSPLKDSSYLTCANYYRFLMNSSTSSQTCTLSQALSSYLSKWDIIYLVTHTRNLVANLDFSLLVFNFLDVIMNFIKTTFNIVLPSQDIGTLKN